MSELKRILIFIDHFLPGYKAGGPVRSVANMIGHLNEHFQFYVITSDREYMENTPYEGIPENEWVEGKLCSVLYASPSAQVASFWEECIRDRDPDLVYINGLYSYRFSILPLRVLKKMEERPRTILAPRGMLAVGAMSIKPLKKRVFLIAARVLGLFKGVAFHVTHAQEAEEVRRWVGARETRILANLPPTGDPGEDPGIEKSPGELKLISIARIAPEKNTLGLLELLADIGKSGTHLSLYGPIYDLAYWEKCRAVMNRMPKGVRVEHVEGIPPDRTLDAIRGHHAFILLTKGENHGHAIIEALRAGRPVIISDRTPWKNVEEKGVGFMGSLSEKKPFERALETLSEMDQERFDRLRERIIERAQAIGESDHLKEGYLRFFQEKG